MMSNNVMWITIVTLLTCLSTETAAQVICVDPIQIGELRVMKSKACFDSDGSSGAGNAQTFRCYGPDDQQIIMCGDGTIRHSQTPYNCLTPARTDGTGNLFFSPCQVLPAIPDYQKWRYGSSKTFVDTGGIRQTARQIRNQKSGLCVDVVDHDGTGNIIAWTCDGREDQYFYFRSRGELLAHGRLQNQQSSFCLDAEGTSARRGENIEIYYCRDEPDQYFSHYQNGEVVNQMSRLCVDVKNYAGSGDIFLWDCEDLPDQMWSQPHQYCLGEYCAFYNKKSGLCLDPAGTAAAVPANVMTNTCQGAPDQRFRWVTEKWVTPTATWNLVGCNQNGGVTHSISNSVEYTSTISTSLAIEIESTIEANVLFSGVSVSTSVSASLANEWSNTYSETRETSVTCEKYDSGQAFTGGCMWQLQVDTKETTNEDPFTWTALIVKCSSNLEAPKCPPFTVCKDESCTMCEDVPANSLKMKYTEALTWKKVLKIE